MLHFIGTCVELQANDLDDFDSSAREISYKTFRKHVGPEIIRELNEAFSVPVGKDWAVSFEKGKWKGKPAVCMHHSCIHHLWELP
jgi:hypothetical protein